MEQGTLKIRVRALENERALERIAAQQTTTQRVVLAVACLNLASLASGAVLSRLFYAAAVYCGAQAANGAFSVSKLDKKNLLYSQPTFDNAVRPSEIEAQEADAEVSPVE
mmetsp:Transcript_17320/g.41143  ORF Transcript_17320/g.41143 Transcript_17320/m.41143 type:complete len:110 (+) Transcript_17320:177-506(+)